ncbi:MAG: outer membrane lipoprotein-sorting protein [Woeseia sp.]
MNFRIALILVVALSANPVHAGEARDIVRAAIDYWRGLSSYSEMTMTIHRPDWERSMSMRAWTQGDHKSLVRITAPRKDRGNGTLIDDDNMWTYSPRINRVIKVPSSMMGQSWLGSDFSNKDISRVDDIVDQYDHRILGEQERDGFLIYQIESIPHEDAAVVWGKEVLRIRADHVVVEHSFYDQDGELVKSLESLDIGDMGGRTVAIRQRMQKFDAPDEWTEIKVDSVQYDLELRDSIFTLSNLRNPRE